jgi:hypothetical protein
MMEINRHNYEAFLLDLLEGNLSVEDQQQVHNFLLSNPECARELMELEPWILKGEEYSFQKKSLLKKEFPNALSSLNDHNFDLFSIARMEGDLSNKQESAHQEMLSLDDLKYQQWSEWQQTRLLPEKLEFKDKNRLKHKSGPKIRIIGMAVISTAAALALLLFLFRDGPDLPQQEQAMQEPLDLPSQGFASEDLPLEDLSARDLTVRQSLDLQSQAEIRKVLEKTPDQEVFRTKDPVLFSVKKEHERPAELGSKMAVLIQDDIQPRLLAVSARQINALSLAEGPVPDKIEALYVPPVPVHLSSLSVAQISDIGLQEVLENYAEEKDISVLTIANAGIKGINKIAGSDLSLMASRDEEGEVSGFQFKGKRFSFSRPLSREE